MKLTKQSILDAYEKTGLMPKDGYYWNFDKDKQINSACAAGVLFLSQKGIKRHPVGEIDLWLDEQLGKKETCSLVRGFDGSERSKDLHDENSYSLGVELRKELLGKDSFCEVTNNV